MNISKVQAEKIKVGDWVRFYSGGRFVIGLVSYVELYVEGAPMLLTDCGVVRSDNVVEVRCARTGEPTK